VIPPPLPRTQSYYDLRHAGVQIFRANPREEMKKKMSNRGFAVELRDGIEI